MAESPDAPPSDTALELIADCQYEADKLFWPEIHAMAVESFIGFLNNLAIAGTPPRPPKPKLPHKLFGISRYAIALFDCASRYYPLGNSQQLIARIEQRIMDHIAMIEKRSLGSLSFHATPEQMRLAIQEALSKHSQRIYASTASTPPPPKIPAGIVASSLPAGSSPKTESIAEQLRTLFDEADLTPQEVATELQVTPKSIYRHIKGEAAPRREHLKAYETLFSKKLNRLIVLKRQKKSIKLQGRDPKRH